VPYGLSSVSFVPFPSIPAGCSQFIPPNPISFTGMPAWVTFTNPTMTIVPQAAFAGLTLTWTFSFYQDGFLPATQTGTIKIVNEGNQLTIGQIQDTNYLLGSNIPIPFPSWSC